MCDKDEHLLTRRTACTNTGGEILSPLPQCVTKMSTFSPGALHALTQVEKFYTELSHFSEEERELEALVTLMATRSAEATRVARENEWIESDEEWYAK